MNNKIIDTPNPPIKNWKDALIRIGIPIAVMATMIYFLLPVAIEQIYLCENNTINCGDGWN